MTNLCHFNSSFTNILNHCNDEKCRVDALQSILSVRLNQLNNTIYVNGTLDNNDSLINGTHHSGAIINNAPQIISDSEYKKLKKGRFLYKRIKFPQCVPQSKIVYENANESENETEFLRMCKLKACTLYRKYVVGGCGLEINVGWSIKKKLLNIMGNNNKNVLDISLVESWHISLFGLIVLFDQCCNQMLVLMQDSFARQSF